MAANVSYASSPEERRIQRMLLPILRGVYAKSAAGKDLYKVPALKFDLPNIQKYMPSGGQYKAAEAKLAPSFWQSYNTNVENPLINRFAGAGQLGSPLGGVSGAGMDALANKREAAQKDISAQVYQSVQNPLLAAYGTQTQAAMKSAMTPYEYRQQMLQYPYQIMPGILGGTMPQAIVQQPSAGGK